MYEFVQKLAKKKKKPGWDFNPGPIWLAIVAAASLKITENVIIKVLLGLTMQHE